LSKKTMYKRRPCVDNHLKSGAAEGRPGKEQQAQSIGEEKKKGVTYEKQTELRNDCSDT